MLVLSEGRIAAQAALYGLRFEGVSDLNSVAGSFAGLFFSKPGSLKPFIVLTFKGPSTAPIPAPLPVVESFSARLSSTRSLSLNPRRHGPDRLRRVAHRLHARPHLGHVGPRRRRRAHGLLRVVVPVAAPRLRVERLRRVHFPLSPSARRGGSLSSFLSTDVIVRALKQVAKALKRDDKTKVQLWVTVRLPLPPPASPDTDSSSSIACTQGHSLGGAYAELAYMRLLASPADLGSDIELRDCYTYGAPRPGDGQLAGEYEKMSLTPLERPNSLWRVKNRLDLVTRVPLGIADDEDRRDALTPLDVLNYAHLGPALRLHKPVKASGQGRFSIEFLGRLKGALHVQIVEEGGAVVPWGVSALDTAFQVPVSASMASPGSHGSSSLATVIVSNEGINPVQFAMKLFATLVPCVWNHCASSRSLPLLPRPCRGPCTDPLALGYSPRLVPRLARQPALGQHDVAFVGAHNGRREEDRLVLVVSSREVRAGRRRRTRLFPLVACRSAPLCA